MITCAVEPPFLRGEQPSPCVCDFEDLDSSLRSEFSEKAQSMHK